MVSGDGRLQRRPTNHRQGHASFRREGFLEIERAGTVEGGNPKFVAAAIIAANPNKYGFANVSYEAPVEYEEVEVSTSVKLEALAAMADMDAKTLQELNPELIRSQIPPGDKPFRVKVPMDRATLLAKALDQKKESEPPQVITHRVQKGETLFSIAGAYGQNVKALMELNGLTTYRLRIGQQLKILVETVRDVIR